MSLHDAERFFLSEWPYKQPRGLAQVPALAAVVSPLLWRWDGTLSLQHSNMEILFTQFPPPKCVRTTFWKKTPNRVSFWEAQLTEVWSGEDWQPSDPPPHKSLVAPLFIVIILVFIYCNWFIVIITLCVWKRRTPPPQNSCYKQLVAVMFLLWYEYPTRISTQGPLLSAINDVWL